MTRLHEFALLALAAVPFLLLVAVGVGRFIRTGRAEPLGPCVCGHDESQHYKHHRCLWDCFACPCEYFRRRQP